VVQEVRRQGLEKSYEFREVNYSIHKWCFHAQFSKELQVHICLISVEIFAWGKYGGYGRATRMIGRELARRGIQVSAIVPMRKDQNEIEFLDGIKVYGFDFRKPVEMLRIFEDCTADIFHSQEPSLATYIAQKMHPDKKHVITFRDTHLLTDWITEFRLPSLNKYQVLFNWFYEDNFLVHHAVRKADKCFVAANLIMARAKKKYGLPYTPEFLPSPVAIPKIINKDSKPTVCYIARWDRRKRPEMMIELANSHPNVHFIMTGSSRDKIYDQELRDKFSKSPNIELTGFINQFESDQLSSILSRSWILINTAAREGLPTSFIEACAHKCAILSSLDPDGFSSQFGYYSSDDDFSEGLKFLLQDNRWKELGQKGYDYVNEFYSLEKAMERHINIYQSLLN
jgi:glycosyltransferase involved in cell wall biosynthesis